MYSVLLTSLLKFFMLEPNKQKLLFIKEKVSLRRVESFVTVYARKHQVALVSDDGSVDTLYQKYKNILHGFGKRHFDPFCRHERLVIKVSEDQTIETTVAQLNFIKWVIECDVLSKMRECGVPLSAEAKPVNSMNAVESVNSVTLDESAPVVVTKQTTLVRRPIPTRVLTFRDFDVINH